MDNGVDALRAKVIVQGHAGGNWSQNSNPGLLTPSIAEGSFSFFTILWAVLTLQIVKGFQNFFGRRFETQTFITSVFLSTTTNSESFHCLPSQHSHFAFYTQNAVFVTFDGTFRKLVFNIKYFTVEYSKGNRPGSMDRLLCDLDKVT